MRRIPPRWSDLALVGGLGCLAVAQMVGDPPQHPALTVPLVGLAIGSLLLRRDAPLLSGTGVIAGLVPLVATTGSPPFATFLAAMVAVYSQTRYASGRRLALGLGVVLTGLALTVAVETGRGGAPFELVYPLVYFGGAAAVGLGVRRLVVLTDRLAAQAVELERTRDSAARLAVAEERARIARDLHDVVAHGVSLMLVQTEAALGVLQGRPDLAQQALGHVQRAGRDALTELQQLVHVLRDDNQATSADDGVPRPGLHQLEALIADARRCGIDVTVEGGTGGPLPAAVDVAAYRVVQEGLTNVIRHSGARRVWVRVQVREDEVEVEVVDDGPGPGAPATTSAGGHGLLGLRERVALVGGQVDAGRLPSTAGRGPAGFRVRAVLPLGSP